jgi:hypothetical protein
VEIWEVRHQETGQLLDQVDKVETAQDRLVLLGRLAWHQLSLGQPALVVPAH